MASSAIVGTQDAAGRYPNASPPKVHGWSRQFVRQHGSASYHRSGGLAVARSERARTPASEERTGTEAPLLSLPLPDDHRVP